MRPGLVRRGVAGAALALVAASSVACGGGGDDGASAPDDASVEEFCDVFNSLVGDVLAAGETAGPEIVDSLRSYGEELAEVGSPEGMPEEAREGLELIIDAINDLPDDATLEDFEDLDGEFSEEEQAAGDAFSTYVTDECPTPDLGLPSDFPTDLPSDFPTDLPSDLPTNLPTELPEGFPTDLSDLPTDPEELASLLEELTQAP